MARECLTIVIAGVKRIGKSNETLRNLAENYVVANYKTPARRALIIDINNEYGKYKIYSSTPPNGFLLSSDENGTYYEYPIKRLAIKDVSNFSTHPKIEIRRIVPNINDNGTEANDEQIMDNILTVIKNFRGGALLLEDLNVVFGDSLPVKISALLCNNAHRGTDLLLHVQSIGRLLPKLLQNTNVVRFHHQLDSVDESKDKLQTHFEIFKIAQILVDKQFFNGNKRFFIYVDRDSSTIKGRFNKPMLEEAIKEYLSMNERAMKPLLVKKDNIGKSIYSYPDALKLTTDALLKRYYGN